MTVRELLDRYLSTRLGLAVGTEEAYATACNLFAAWRPGASVADLTPETVGAFLRHRLAAGKAHATVKRDRRHLLTLWRFAFRKRLTDVRCEDVPDVAVPRRSPQAWTPDEVGRILAFADSAAVAGFHGGHWRALVLVMYDTAERVGALLKTPAAAFCGTRRLLVVPAEARKTSADMPHRLHPETVAAVVATYPDDAGLLFPWPYRQRHIYRVFRRLLQVAGLPCTRRDLFHRIRRTSYTQVAAALGVEAATRHAGHSCDLSRFYLDSSLMPDVPVADVIPRPRAG